MLCCMPRWGTLACTLWLGLLPQLQIASAMGATTTEVKSSDQDQHYIQRVPERVFVGVHMPYVQGAEKGW